MVSSSSFSLSRAVLGGLTSPKTPLTNSLSLCRRGIAGKVLRDRSEPKPAPWDYNKKSFNLLHGLYDKTTLRLDENSKMIMVDGAHAVGKTQFAQDLAEELEMLYMPKITMDDFYINKYGEDARKLDEYLTDRNKSYDEKDFFRNPVALPGCYDRMHNSLFKLMVHQHLLALRHILNTGQGVVMERGPFSDLIYAQAAVNAGWMSQSSVKFMRTSREMCMGHLFRPNLIIWLDAPISEVQKKICSRGNEWDKDSPVWKNSQYLHDIYEGMKNNYLQKARNHSQVLVYDWTVPGDIEVVVEDIEDLNFDYYGLHDEQQKDWRWFNEAEATSLRIHYSNPERFRRIMAQMEAFECFEAEHLYKTREEDDNMAFALLMLKGNGYATGYNEVCGDNVLFKSSKIESMFSWQQLWSIKKSDNDKRYV
ncbi:NADH dehydrogenase [ubiquinone] 1 alpha subcomplex subunit 10, mitochondrial-like [Tigriopus californicus]|nr:NADH dehydrogenase [ubiquinone] 1 alpha subcomplex subunit 10, mitochondrial-like [Tigriopus californicus]